MTDCVLEVYVWQRILNEKQRNAPAIGSLLFPRNDLLRVVRFGFDLFLSDWFPFLTLLLNQLFQFGRKRYSGGWTVGECSRLQIAPWS